MLDLQHNNLFPFNSYLQLGSYNPIPSKKDGLKEISVHSERVRYWLSVGAQMSDRCHFLLGRVGIIPEMVRKNSPIKGLPRAVRKEMKEKAKQK